MTKVLAAIVAPPHMTASGGAKAGEMLSAALASRCDMTVASMMNGFCDAREAGFERIMVRSRLPFLYPPLPTLARYRALFYRSDIPEMIRRRRFDLVHLHNPTPSLEMARVARACREEGIPYVVSTHGFNEVANGRAIYGFDPLRQVAWRRLVEAPVAEVVRHANAVFALSPADFGIVRNMGFGGTISIVANGVPMPGHASKPLDDAILARLGIAPARPGGPASFMFLANHTPNKGLPTLLAAFAALDRPYQLVIGGEKRDGIDYEGAVRTCRPGQRIVVTGRLEDNEVAAVFRRSDVFVFPTLADTFPLVVLEAMSHGLPVIASNVGGIPHQLAADCGVLVPPGEIDALVDAIAVMADDPSRSRAMGENARCRVRDSYSWESAADAALTGYARVLGQHALTPRLDTKPEQLIA
jgi:starch synthase